MNSKLALMPLLIMSAFSYAADEATPETPVQQQLQAVPSISKPKKPPMKATAKSVWAGSATTAPKVRSI